MPDDMHPEDVKAAIRKRGTSIAALADEHGISRQSLAASIGSRVSGRAERIIADFIGMSPARIWPSRYDKRGRRIEMKRRKPESSAA